MRVAARTQARRMVREILDRHTAGGDTATTARAVVARLQTQPACLIALAGFVPADILGGPPPPPSDDDDTPLSTLHLSTRAENIAMRYGVFTVEVLAYLVDQHRDPRSLWEFTEWDHCGPKLAEEICLRIDEWRREDNPDPPPPAG